MTRYRDDRLSEPCEYTPEPVKHPYAVVLFAWFIIGGIAWILLS